MNLDLPGLGESDTFALASTISFITPAAAARIDALCAEVAATPPPPPRPVFRLTDAQRAAIERNCARLAKFSPASDTTTTPFHS